MAVFNIYSVFSNTVGTGWVYDFQGPLNYYFSQFPERYSGSFSTVANPNYSIENLPNGFISGITYADYFDITGLNIKSSTYLNYFEGGEVKRGMDLQALLFRGNDTININTSDEGRCFISGFGGNDSITSSYGDDFLFGGLGKDVLSGGEGDDWLFGEKGQDTLTGGSGSDRFGFDGLSKLVASNVDTITDFQPGLDMLVFDVRAGSAFEDLGGDNIFVSVAGVAKAKSGEQFIYDTKNGNFFFDADGAGTGDKAILVAKFVGIPIISVDDIYFGSATQWET